MASRWVRGALVLAAVTGLAACSSDGGDEPATQTTQTGGGPADGVVTVTIAGFAFEPSSVVLPAGDTLTIRNEDTAAHTFTMDDGSLDVSLEPGQQVEVTPETGGPFHCEIHASMTGTLALG
jgi:plastocyanin